MFSFMISDLLAFLFIIFFTPENSAPICLNILGGAILASLLRRSEAYGIAAEPQLKL
jgi:hypothetical protein